MTGMLASVNSLEEALIVQQAQVEIIDLKQPERGALGALDLEVVREIVLKIKQEMPISATVGDLEMQPELVFNAVQAMAVTGVDYVKIGIFPNGDIFATLEKLKDLTAQGSALIAVLFADNPIDLNLVAAIKAAGFTGVMLDTMQKKSGSLTQLLSMVDIKNFVSLAQQAQLLCGLAGSLRENDIQTLLPLGADYLGFRGALCQQHNRAGQLDFAAIQRIKQAMS
jgi:uncharacterized protein (UPF0264 family)